MTDWLLALVPQYGLWLLAFSTFCACVALPIPASILMLTAGGFISAGDLSLSGSVIAALTGAVAGDQMGYCGGRWAGTRLKAWLGSRAAPIDRASELLSTRGGFAVFLSRWLISGLGPYVNLAAGAARQPWSRFSIWAIAGEALWVSLYVGLGYLFTGNIEAASEMAFNFLGLLAAGAVAVALGLWLIAVVRSETGRNERGLVNESAFVTVRRAVRGR